MEKQTIDLKSGILLQKKITSFNSLYIDYRKIELNSKVIGHVSIEKCDVSGKFTIDISIKEENRKKGYGTKILREYLKYIFDHTKINEIADVILDKDQENAIIQAFSEAEKHIQFIRSRNDLTDEKKKFLINKKLEERNEMYKAHLDKNFPSRRLHEKLGFKKDFINSVQIFTITKEQFLNHNYPYTTVEKSDKEIVEIVDLLLEKAPIVIKLSNIDDIEIRNSIKSSMPTKYLENQDIIEFVKLGAQKKYID
jgi:hypothetical protein